MTTSQIVTAPKHSTHTDIAFISDILDAATKGKTNLGYGHSFADPQYWNTPGVISTELLANYGGSAIGNHIEYEAIRALFPNTSKVLDELIEVMADGSI